MKRCARSPTRTSRAGDREPKREEWRNLRFQDALGLLDHLPPDQSGPKNIARLKTIQREREIAADPEKHFAETSPIRRGGDGRRSPRNRPAGGRAAAGGEPGTAAAAERGVIVGY
ncbi:MAG: hypothetical protein U0232_07670 [Thermomicrobiales bacterium]